MNSRSILIVFLILITVVLVGAAIVIGGQLGIAPDTTPDVSVDGICCTGGSCIDSGFSFGEDTGFQGGSCNDRKVAACGSAANTNGSDPCSVSDSGGDSGNDGGSDDCTGKNCGAGTCFTGPNDNDGGWGCNCNNGTTLGPSTNPGTCPSTDGDTDSGGTKGPGETCTPGVDTCSNNYVCTPGNDGVNRCNTYDTGNCTDNGATCGGTYIAFHCDGDFGSECLSSNNITTTSYSAAQSHVNGCGQIDEVWDGGPCNRQACGSIDVIKSNCASAPDGGDGNDGSDGTSTPPPTNPPVSVSCGETCTNDNNCPDNHQCVDDTCVFNICVDDPELCDSDGCTPLLCGNGEMDEGEECGEPGLTCAQGQTCNTSQCICQTNECGDPCDSDINCPVGHVCSENTCILQECLVEGACFADQCTIAPVTAIISDEADRILFGIVLIVAGFLAIRLGMFESALNFATVTMPQFSNNIKSKRKKSRIDEFESQLKD
jgi:hypothetical protein